MWKFKCEIKEAKDNLLNLSNIDDQPPQPVSLNMIYNSKETNSSDYQLPLHNIHLKNYKNKSLIENEEEISIEEISSWANKTIDECQSTHRNTRRSNNNKNKSGIRKIKNKKTREQKANKEMMERPRALYFRKRSQSKLQSSSLDEVTHSKRKKHYDFDYSKDYYNTLNKTVEGYKPGITSLHYTKGFSTLNDVKVFKEQKIKSKNLEYQIPSNYYYEMNKQPKFPKKMNVTRLNDQFNSRLRAKKNEVMRMARLARERIKERKHREIKDIVNFLNKVKINESNSVEGKSRQGDESFVKEDYQYERVKTVFLPKFNKGISFVKRKGEYKWKVTQPLSKNNLDIQKINEISSENRKRALEILTSTGLLLPIKDESNRHNRRSSHHFQDLKSKKIFEKLEREKMRKKKEYMERINFIKVKNIAKLSNSVENRKKREKGRRDKLRSSSVEDNIIIKDRRYRNLGYHEGYRLLDIMRIDRD